jgi:VanZ family protein
MSSSNIVKVLSKIGVAFGVIGTIGIWFGCLAQAFSSMFNNKVVKAIVCFIVAIIGYAVAFATNLTAYRVIDDVWKDDYFDEEEE